MHKSIFLVLLLTASTFTAEGSFGFEEEDDVLVLTDKTYEEVIKKYEFVLVEFYAPWCGHCKKLAPEFSAAAKILKGLDTPVPLGKVDATVNKESAKKNGVSGYPTLKFFVNGVASDYKGGRTTDDIVRWIKRKTGPTIEVLKSTDALEKTKKENKVTVVFFGTEDHKDFAAFKSVAVAEEKLSFFRVSDEKEITANGNVITVFTKHNDGTAHHPAGTVTVESINSLITDNRYPLVMEFEGDEAIERVFTNEAPAVVVFSDSEIPLNKELVGIAKSDKNTEKPLIYMTSKVTTGLGKRLSEYIGLDASKTPAVWIVKPSGGNVEKFRMEGELTADNVKAFAENYRSGSLTKSFKSAPVPATNDEPVKIIVGKNFDDLIINNDKFVLLKFYAPWCGHCKKLAPIYDEFAKKFAHLENLIVAKIDSTENEIPGIAVQGFPTLKWFSPGKKDTPEAYSGERDLEGLTAFIKEKMGETFSEAEETDL